MLNELTCEYCQQEFTPTGVAAEDGGSDILGAPCCDNCYHADCEHGHHTADQYEECEWQHDDEIELIDPDAIHDRRVDALMGM
jgi:hypothetical protein